MLFKKTFIASMMLAGLLVFDSASVQAQVPSFGNDDAPSFQPEALAPSPNAGAPSSGFPSPSPSPSPFGAPALPLGNAGGQAGGSPFGGSFIPPSAEEIQQQMEEDAEVQKEKARQMAFDAALEGLMPLTPEEIREVLEVFKVNREAAETPIAVPEPKIYVGNVSLDPSATPLVIQTAPGYVSTVTILDMTGAPWPVQDISWAGEFDVIPPEEGGNVMRITPLTAHGRGNISIRLVDLITPITLSMNTQLDVAHYRFDAHIPQPGPLANIPIVEKGGIETVAESEGLIKFMDGYVPSDAEAMTVSGADGRTRAWKMGGRVILRTPLTLLSPSWDSSIASGDGTRVYSLKDTPVVLLSERGQMVQAHLSIGALADE